MLVQELGWMDTQQGLEGEERAQFLLCMLSYSLNTQACIIYSCN